jgi:transcriptional regulator with PAS, ATPase and Fis domain
MKSDLNDLKKLTLELMQNGNGNVQENNQNLIRKIYGNNDVVDFEDQQPQTAFVAAPAKQHFEHPEDDDYTFAETVEEEEILRLEQKEIEMIKKALQKNKGKRKAAADELGISERTLYRKIKQFDL